MPDDTTTPRSPLATAAAAFLAQVLGLDDAPEAITSELTVVREDRQAAIYSVELDSSIGNAAFLIYGFRLAEVDDSGSSGADRYREGLETLRSAAERDSPGPRMVAHAETGALGFILATTPATWRALQGNVASTIEATAADLPPTAVSRKQRGALAEDLHRSLRDASGHARHWLAAIRAAEAGRAEAAFTEAETALALFVLDNDNVQPLLTALNLLVTTAKSQAVDATTANQSGLPASQSQDADGASES